MPGVNILGASGSAEFDYLNVKDFSSIVISGSVAWSGSVANAQAPHPICTGSGTGTVSGTLSRVDLPSGIHPPATPTIPVASFILVRGGKFQCGQFNRYTFFIYHPPLGTDFIGAASGTFGTGCRDPSNPLPGTATFLCNAGINIVGIAPNFYEIQLGVVLLASSTFPFAATQGLNAAATFSTGPIMESDLAGTHSFSGMMNKPPLTGDIPGLSTTFTTATASVTGSVSIS